LTGARQRRLMVVMVTGGDAFGLKRERGENPRLPPQL
jgi:hypothetical protein